MRVLLVVLVVIVAGCASSSDDETPGPETTTSGASGQGNGTTTPGSIPLEAVGANLAECEQLHTFMPTPAALFDGMVPSGYTLITDGATTDVFVFWQFCDNGSTRLPTQVLASKFDGGATFLAALQVTPPTGLANDTALLDLIPLTWAEDEALMTGVLTAWGVPGVETASVFLSGSGGGVGVDEREYDASPAVGRFSAVTAISPEGGTNDANAYRVWVPADGGAAGYVRIENSQCNTIGSGAGTLQFAGSPTAAPVLRAGQAHLVDGAQVAYRYVDLS